MQIEQLHEWTVDPKEAREIQKRLAERVSLDDAPALDDVRLIAGLDNAYARTAAETTGYAAAVVMTWPELEILEVATAARPVDFPYVPGLLSFREIPVVVEALRQLDATPDLLICDGHGLAHPRRFGLACHVGLLTGVSTIGCAKKPLVGDWEMPGPEPGSSSPITIHGERVGTALRTRSRRRLPLFVSPGHRISIDTAAHWALQTATKHLPAPQQAAHDEVTRLRALSAGGTQATDADR